MKSVLSCEPTGRGITTGTLPRKSVVLGSSHCSLVVLKIIANVLKDQPSTLLTSNEPTVERIGTILATDHILAFEISSVLLLGALIGAAVISRPRKERHD